MFQQQEVSNLDVARLENEEKLEQIRESIQKAEQVQREMFDKLNEIRKLNTELNQKADPLEVCTFIFTRIFVYCCLIDLYNFRMTSEQLIIIPKS